LTGLGLTGLALGFALKDIISNFVSGLLILALRPFELGDQIIVGETEGSVQRIDLRATQIRTYDGRIVLVPNGEVFTSRVINNTAAPLRRASVVVPISYATDLPQALVVVRDAVAVAEGVLPEPPPSVRVRELGLGDVLIEARFWTDSRRSDVVATISTVNTAIVAAMHAARLPLPDPGARTITPANAAAWRDVLEQNQHECVPEAHDAALERPRK
jgi:small conductance mechanosensitive channel